MDKNYFKKKQHVHDVDTPPTKTPPTDTIVLYIPSTERPVLPGSTLKGQGSPF